MKYALINGILLDGTPTMEPQRGRVILIDGEKIADIVDEAAERSGYTEIDLKGQYVMPGLINLHVHLPASGKPKKKASDPKKLVKLLTSTALLRAVVKKMCLSYAQTQLNSGVTTIRTVGGVLSVDSMLRDEIAAGRVAGPRILAANMAVSVPGGHMAGSLAYIAESPGEAAAYVRKIAADKPDLIKLMITGGVLDAKKRGEPGELRMPPEYVRAACGEAHKLGLKVAAHVESPEGVRVALENGVDTIEHGSDVDESLLSLFIDRSAALISTISPALPFALFDREISHATELSQFNGKVVMDGCISGAKKCLAAGVPVGLGTDTGCPFITHYDTWRELNYFVKYCDVDNRFALYTATKGNAEIAGLGDITGTLEPGKCADLIVTARNPLEDLQALRQVELVMARGRLTVKPRVRKLSEAERELDKFL